MASSRVFVAAAALFAIACRHEPDVRVPIPLAVAPEPVDLDVVRAGILRCPVPLTDEALDDLDSYSRCWLAPDVERLVRADYVDDEIELPDMASLGRHAGSVPRWRYEEQLRRFVDPGDALAGSIAISDERLLPDPILAPDVSVAFAPDAAEAPVACTGSKCAGRLLPDLQLPYRPARQAELAPLRTLERPLAGVRVGIDPGHAGGRYGAFEERRLTMVAPGRAAEVIQEGDLTLRTALELRSKLAALGADVVMTREAPGFVHPSPLHAFRPAAERLLRRLSRDPGYISVERSLAPGERIRLRTALAMFAVRRQNTFEGLRWRARLLANERPDLVISIHFNAGPATEPGSRQGVVAMIAGNHDAKRLYNPHHRWRALEQAFAVDDFNESARLGALCVQRMSNFLQLTVERGAYPDHVPIRDQTGQPLGVAAWNGVLLRYLDGVAVLTEGPFMDDVTEFRRLRDALGAAPGTPGTRTERYAAALAACVEDFVASWLSGSGEARLGKSNLGTPDAAR